MEGQAKKVYVITQHEVLTTEEGGHCDFLCAWLHLNKDGSWSCDLFGDPLTQSKAIEERPERLAQCIDSEEF
jgi:hypothetical protein